MVETGKIQNLIASILREKVYAEEPTPTTDLIQIGLLDSITLLSLILGIEEQFGIRVPLEDMEIDQFRSIERIAEFVSSSLAHESGEKV